MMQADQPVSRRDRGHQRRRPAGPPPGPGAGDSPADVPVFVVNATVTSAGPGPVPGACRRAGAVRVLQPADMPLGERIATIADPDGNPAAALQRAQPIALMTGGGYLSL
jgi:hypothetical protein